MNDKSTLLKLIKLIEFILLISVVGSYFFVTEEMFKPVAVMLIGCIFMFLFIEGTMTGIADARLMRVEKKNNSTMYLLVMAFDILLFCFAAGYFAYKLL